MAGSKQQKRLAGKLITGRVFGLVLDAGSRRAISDGVISGVTLFKDNARDLNQLCDLVDDLLEVGGDDFIVAADQEGGLVQRFEHVLTPIPSAMALSALHHDGRVLDALSTAAGQLKLLGVNVNLAPVLDVNSNPYNPIIGTRSFSDDPLRVSSLAELSAKAHRQNGVLAVAKHFPGHGDTFEDSHLGLAVVGADKDLLESREFKPFAQCAMDFKAMLIGHVWLTAYDQEPLPASLSRTIIEDVLRNQLKFDGYLFTDDMPVMRAIMDRYGLEEACVASIVAGADNVLVSGSLEQMQAVNNALVKAIESGHIKEDRINQSLARRQAALKMTRGGAVNSHDARQQLENSIAESHQKMLQLSTAAICAVRGAATRLDGGDGEWVLLAPLHPRYELNLYEQLMKRQTDPLLKVDPMRFALDPDAEDIERIAAFAASKNCLLLTFKALLHEGQMKLAERLSRVCKKKIAVACDVPYELFFLHNWQYSIATFDPSNLAMEALAALLLEGLPARGTMPVKLEEAMSRQSKPVTS